jgi:hypothetical protein
MKSTSLTKIERDRQRELQRLAERIKKTQHAADLLRIERDHKLHDWHADGSSVEMLSNAAGLTRQGLYDAIGRVRKGRK